MAQQTNNLILKLKLDVDTSSGEELIVLTKELNSNIKAIENNTRELQQVENIRFALASANMNKLEAVEIQLSNAREQLSKKTEEAFNRLQTILEKNNQALAENGKYENLRIANVQRAIDAYNKIKQLNDEIDKQLVSQANTEQLKLNLANSLLSTQDRINKAYGEGTQQLEHTRQVQQQQAVGSLKFSQTTPATQPTTDTEVIKPTGSFNYATGGISDKVKQANQIALDALEKSDYDLVEKAIAKREKQEEKRTNDLVSLYNKRASRLAAEGTKELAALEAAREDEQKTLNSRLAQEQKFTEEAIALQNKRYNEAKALEDKRLAEELAQQQAVKRAEEEALNYRLSLEAKQNQELQALLNKRQAEKDEQVRKQIEQERKLAEQISNAKAGYAQQALGDGSSLASATRDRELAALRSSIEEQHKLRMDSFNNTLSQQEARIKSSIAIQTAEQVHGIQSIEAIRARAAQASEASERQRQARLSNITRRVETGSITPDSGIALAERAHQRYAQSITQTNTELQRHEEITRGVTREHTNLFNRVGQLISAYAIWNTVVSSLKAVPNIGIELESTKASLEATTGSAAGMGSVMTALEAEAKRTGIEIGTLRETFRGFQASTSLAGETIDSTWHMFTNLNTVITGLHLPADKANGIFLAMAQIFNKTKVQSEELVKQLGNLLPGAFASFATANNVAFGGQFKNSIDLIAQMKKGTVFAHETVERFTQFLADRFEPAFALASNGLNASIGRMKTSFTLLGESVYNMSSGLILKGVQALDSFATYMRGAVEGTNNFGTVIKEVAIVALSLMIGLTAKAIQTTVMSTAATIVETNAIAARAAARRLEAVAAGIQIGAIEKMTFASAASTIAMNGLRTAMAFLASPAGIITGIAVVVASLFNFIGNMKSASNEAEDFLAKTKENLDKVAQKPITLEMRIDADPEVVKAKKAIADLETTIARAKDVTSGGNWIENIINKASLGKDMHNLEEMKRLLIVLQEKAHINVNVENAEALKNIDQIAEHFHLLALQAKGLTLEAAQTQFDITNASKMAELQKQITVSEQEKSKEKVIQDRYDRLQAERAAREQDLKANGTWGKKGAFKSKEFSTAEITAIETQFATLEQNRTNRANAQIALDEAILARKSIGLKDQEEKETKYANYKLALEEDTYGKAKTLAEATAIAEAKAGITANNRLKEQAQLMRELQNIKEEERTPKQKAQIDENSEIVAKIEKARQKTVSDSIDAFNKSQESAAKSKASAARSANAEMEKLHKIEYKDIERNAELINRVTESGLAEQDTKYAKHLISINQYYDEKQRLQLDNIKQLQENYKKEYDLAVKYGDKPKAEQAADKITALQPKVDTINEQISKDRTQAQDAFNNSLLQTKSNLFDLVGANEAAARAAYDLAQKQEDYLKLKAEAPTNAGANTAYKEAQLVNELNYTNKIADANATYKARVDAVKQSYVELNSQTSASLNQSLGAFGPLVNVFDQYAVSINDLNTKISDFSNTISNLETQKEIIIKYTPENAEAIAAIDKQIDITKQERGVQQAKLDKEQISSATNVFSTIEGMTNKESRLHKAAHTAKMVMNGIEFAFKLKDMAMTVVSFTTGFALKAKDMAMNLIALPSALALGAAQMFAQSGWAGFAGVAAMMAVIAGIGAAISSSSSGPKVTDTSAPITSDTGTVLGDKEAKSTSLENTLSLLLDINYKSYQELAKINRNLLNTSNVTNKIINAGVQGNLLGKTPDLTKSSTGTDAAKIAAIGVKAISTVMTAINITESIVNAVMGLMAFNPVGILLAGLAQIPAIGKIINKVLNFFMEGLFGKVSIKKIDEGLMIRARSARALLTGSKAVVDQYTTLEKTTESWFDKSVEIYDVFQKATDNTIKLFTNLYFNISTSVKNLAVNISKAATDAVYLYKFPEVKISFSGKTGKQISEKLKALVNKQMDKMATAVFGSIFGIYQQVGEGMFQTINRLYTEQVVAKKAIEDIGGTFEPNVEAGIHLADALIQVSSNADTAAGRLKEFAQQEADFAKNFLTTNQKNTLAVQNFADSLTSIFQTGLSKEQVGAAKTFTDKQEKVAVLKPIANKADKDYADAFKAYNDKWMANWTGKLSDAKFQPYIDKVTTTKAAKTTANANLQTAIADLVPASTVTSIKTLKDIFFESVKTTGDFGSAIVEMKKDLDITTDSGKQTYAMLNALDTTFTSLTADILKPIDDQINTIKDSIDARTVEQKMSALAASKDINEQRKLTTSLQKQITAKYDTEKSAITNIKNSFIKLADTVKSLLLSDLSTLDPYAKFKEAEKEYNLTLEQTRSTDLTVASEAAGKLGTVAQNYLKEAQSYYGATETYASIFTTVTSTLSDLSNTASTQADASTEAIKTLGEAAIKQLEDLANGFNKSVAESLKDLVANSDVTANTNNATDMLDKLTTSAGNLGQSFDDLIVKFNTMMGITPTKEKSNMQTLVDELVSAQAKGKEGTVGKDSVTIIQKKIDAYGKGFAKGGTDLGALYATNRATYENNLIDIATLTAQRDAEKDKTKKVPIQEQIDNLKKVNAEIKTIGMFANGGTASGLAIVGERGPELVRFPNNTNVINNNVTNRLLEDSNKESVENLSNIKQQLIIANSSLITIINAIKNIKVSSTSTSITDKINKSIYDKSIKNYGYREDGTPKGSGFLGEKSLGRGKGVATEYSVGVNIKGKDIDVPTLIPTLTKNELKEVLKDAAEGVMPSQSIIVKAIDFATDRLASGKSVYANTPTPVASQYNINSPQGTQALYDLRAIEKAKKQETALGYAINSSSDNLAIMNKAENDYSTLLTGNTTNLINYTTNIDNTTTSIDNTSNSLKTLIDSLVLTATTSIDASNAINTLDNKFSDVINNIVNSTKVIDKNILIAQKDKEILKKTSVIKEVTKPIISKDTFKLESKLQSVSTKKDVVVTKDINSDNNETLIVLTDMKKELIILNDRMATIERKTRLSKSPMSIA